MKTSFSKVAGGLALLAVSSLAMASVVDTVHNLGATGTSNHTNATSEICVFCHTPHGGDESVDAPLWNRSVSTSGFTRFSSMGRLTFDAAETSIGSVSAACLSCHDGTQAMDAMINYPGTGSTSFGSGDATGGGGWIETNTMGDGSMTESAGGVTGDMIYLGTDLRNDHPISMQYGGGGMDTGASYGSTTDPDFAQGAAGQGNPGGLCDQSVTTYTCTPSTGAASNAASNNTTGAVAGSGTGRINYVTATSRWFVDTGTAGYQSTDFPLYTRVTSVLEEPTVECGTCHDPHSANSTFLRLVGGNRGSQVCLTCHAK